LASTKDFFKVRRFLVDRGSLWTINQMEEVDDQDGDEKVTRTASAPDLEASATPEMSPPDHSPSILSSPVTQPVTGVCFNQTGTFLAVASSRGFRIAQTIPSFTVCAEFLSEGCRSIQMLNSTRLVAVVGAGDESSFSPRVVRLIDAAQKDRIIQLNFTQAVLRVRLSVSRLVAVTEKKVHVFDLKDLEHKLHSVETGDNPAGICPMVFSDDAKMCLVAWPAKPGEIIIYDALNIRVLSLIKAHDSSVREMEFSKDGKMIATTSSKGTIVRVFSIPEGMMLYEFRRGMKPAVVTSLAFDISGSLLCAASDRNSIHVFDIGALYDFEDSQSIDLFRKSKKKRLESKSAGSIMPSMFSSDLVRDSARFRLRDDSKLHLPVVSFDPSGRILVFSMALGTLFIYSFDSSKDCCSLVSEHRVF
jgi:WD40 repeat protein